MKRKVLIDIIAGLFIILFLYTALNKLIDHSDFIRAMQGSNPLAPHAVLLSWVVPLGELLLVALLFIPRTQKIGLYGSTLAMVIFTGYITYMLTASTFRPCGCGGVLQSLTWPQHLVLNIVYTLLGFWSLWLIRKRNSDQHLHIKKIPKPA